MAATPLSFTEQQRQPFLARVGGEEATNLSSSHSLYVSPSSVTAIDFSSALSLPLGTVREELEGTVRERGW